MPDLTSSPQSLVPSITLQITKSNGELFMEASEAVNSRVAQLTTNAPDAASRPLHEMLYEAAQQCGHPLVSHFLEKVSNASLSEKEINGAFILFHDSDKATKLRYFFSQLSSTAGTTSDASHSVDDALLSRSSAVSLFRTILTAISAGLHNSEHHDENGNDVIVEGKPSNTSPERPTKKARIHHGEGTVSTKDETEDDSRVPCQSPSWDSSLATLRDEDDHGCLRKEIEEIATFAADDLIRYALKNRRGDEEADVSVDFAMFGNWYNDSGSSIVPWIELLQLSKWKAPAKPTTASKTKSGESNGTAKTETDDSSPGSLTTEEESRTLVSFDFNGSGSPQPLLIKISEDNLLALQALVQRTNLVQRTAADVCKLLLNAGCQRTVNGKEWTILRKDDFERTVQSIIPKYIYTQLTEKEKQGFSESFFDFFSCFEEGKAALHEGEVDLKEFAVGFCFFCEGNKSTKLATGFELLDNQHQGYLTEEQLLRYLQSYLTMLVGMSLLTPNNKRHRQRNLTSEKRKAMRIAVENGAKWTLGHFLRASGQTKNEYTFESFATWYSEGGYNIAPWLELLDLNKIMSLISDPSSPMPLPPLDMGRAFQTTERRVRHHDRVSSLRRHHSSRRGLPPEVLFTFPLGNRRSLVVLKEDATYVRAVVEQLGLLSMKPDDLWTDLSSAVEKHQPLSSQANIAIYVSMDTFVQGMQEICPRINRKRSAPGSSKYTTSSTIEELLSNFYQCFDIDQSDSVALDELMGGLTLLCGGKKSHKLAFAFSIFDTRPGVHGTGKKRGIVHSLCGEDLFLFLRSILIVTFSTCRISLDLTDEMVGRCIADTANMICNDVMRHQWETKHLDRLDFDEFGQWYNDGGFERAPWLELLDLRKWVLIDDPEPPRQPQHHVSQRHAPLPHISSTLSHEMPILPDSSIPPPPPEDALDHSFFDTDSIMPIDSMDEMDMILMQPSTDKDDFPKISKSFSYSPRQQQQPQRTLDKQGNPLKFHLNTTDDHGGYMLSLSQARIRHFRHILEASGIHKITSETACNHILSKGSGSKITKNEFDSAIRSMLPPNGCGRLMDKLISDVFSGLFAAFDRDGTREANALEVACGFTVLCRGKKSDKLEFAFEVLDRNKRGHLSTTDMACYLQSFLTVLLSIAFSPALDNDPSDDTIATMNDRRCDRTTSTLVRAAKAGADWAASLAFSDFERNKKQAGSMSFDDFADWYTAVGYSSIPWLELLDLQKWAVTSETK